MWSLRSLFVVVLAAWAVALVVATAAMACTRRTRDHGGVAAAGADVEGERPPAAPRRAPMSHRYPAQAPNLSVKAPRLAAAAERVASACPLAATAEIVAHLPCGAIHPEQDTSPSGAVRVAPARPRAPPGADTGCTRTTRRRGSTRGSAGGPRRSWPTTGARFS